MTQHDFLQTLILNEDTVCWPDFHNSEGSREQSSITKKNPQNNYRQKPTTGTHKHKLDGHSEPTMQQKRKTTKTTSKMGGALHPQPSPLKLPPPVHPGQGRSKPLQPEGAFRNTHSIYIYIYIYNNIYIYIYKYVHIHILSPIPINPEPSDMRPTSGLLV